jgi:hypothetical protein
MVHLTIDQRPICEFLFHKCQFSTRREAFDALLKIDSDQIVIALGPCPHTQKENRS